MPSTEPGVAPRRVFGIDFSGGAKAGNKIWIASGWREDAGLTIDTCGRAADLPNSDRSLAASLAALRRVIESSPEAVFGFDFPFGLPLKLCRTTTWEAEILSFPDAFPSAAAFRQNCRDRCQGKEMRRTTDRETETPFSPYNLRMFRQTDAGIRLLLAPLVAARKVSAPPMMPIGPGRAVVIEVCPASTLKRLGLYDSFRGYKGRSENSAAKRRSLLATLQSTQGLHLSDQTLPEKIEADSEGDALDSVVAALAASRAARQIRSLEATNNPAYRMEGLVYT